MLSLDGKKDVVATSYYKDVNNYLSKNASYIYGPHKFTKDGKEKDVKGIQLNRYTVIFSQYMFKIKDINIMVLMVKKQLKQFIKMLKILINMEWRLFLKMVKSII